MSMKKFTGDQRAAVRVALSLSKQLTSKLEAQVAHDGGIFNSQVDVWTQFSFYEVEAEQLRAKLLDVAWGGVKADPKTGHIILDNGFEIVAINDELDADEADEAEEEALFI